MEFSPQQVEALDRIKLWHADAKRGDAQRTFRLFGYAGTGKTTLAKEMMNFADKVQYMSLTGKAALVLRSKGCGDAKTIHSMIYRSMDKSVSERDRLKSIYETLLASQDPADILEAEKMAVEIEQLNRDLQQPSFQLSEHAFDREWVEADEEGLHDGYYRSISPPDLLVVDEVSMVDSRIGRDLESFEIPILVIGDPAQLPPVGGGGYFTGTKERPVKPDMLLTEIHRQAADNPVIKIATRIREGSMPPLGRYGDSRIVNKTDLTAEEWLAADQILAGKNATRGAINRRVRALKGFDGFLPCPGERLVCLRNNHERGLLNGSLWEAEAVIDIPGADFFTMRVRSLDDLDRDAVETCVHKKPFMGGKFEDSYERRTADEFDFGWCITTHKAQGSEWPSVIYIDEWPGQEKRQHQYTGVTRASEKITVVKW